MKNEEKEENDYKFEQIVISNESCSRLLDIKSTDKRAREISPEMTIINNLSRFLLSANTEESRATDALLRRLCSEAENNRELFESLCVISKEVTERLRGFSPDSPQRLLLVVYTHNCLKDLS